MNPPLSTTYKPVADKLIAASLADGDGYANLAYLCDHIGKRNSGSEPLARAIDWATGLMRKEGLANVHTQAATVPHWVRGEESGEIVAPVTKKLHLLGLGMSVATPPGGLTAEVVVVPDFAALDKLGKAGVQGRIVVYNAPYKGYGQTVMYRTAGPSHAAALGAVGVLVRSITPLAVQLPHTGTTQYDEAQPKIPAAAISLEDAMMLERLQAEGAPVKVHMQMQAHLEAPVVSANVMGEIVGSEHPEQVVVLGGHIDSWDVGQGAQDDGSGIMATLAAVNVIKKMGLKPKRTIRIVFLGERGEWRRRWEGLSRRVDRRPACESRRGHRDGWRRGGSCGLWLRRCSRWRRGPSPVAAGRRGDSPIGATALSGRAALAGHARGHRHAADAGRGGYRSPRRRRVGYLADHGDGVPGLGETTTAAHYFDWHHTEADTLDKVDPVEFRKNVASLAVMTFILADMPERLAGHKGAGE